MSSMRAVVLRKYNEPPHLEQVAVPVPGTGEALVKVAYCGINRIDVRVLSGAIQSNVNLPLILGAEITGTVQNGRHVAVNPYLYCGTCRYCLKKQYLVCERGRPLVGIQQNGGFADYVIVPEKSLVEIPQGVPLDQAAAVLLSGGTAYHMVYTKADVQSGDWAIVSAAAGSVGVYACQFLQQKGAQVIALIGNDDKKERLQQLGIVRIVNYLHSDWLGEIQQIISGSLVTTVIDSVGGVLLEQLIRLTSPLGTIVTCGATQSQELKIDLVDLYMKQKTLVGSSGFTNIELSQLYAQVKRKNIVSIIDSVYPLKKISQAWEKLRSRQVVGKILINLIENPKYQT